MVDILYYMPLGHIKIYTNIINDNAAVNIRNSLQMIHEDIFYTIEVPVTELTQVNKPLYERKRNSNEEKKQSYALRGN